MYKSDSARTKFPTPTGVAVSEEACAPALPSPAKDTATKQTEDKYRIKTPREIFQPWALCK
jgi:hypothetical protein